MFYSLLFPHLIDLPFCEGALLCNTPTQLTAAYRVLKHPDLLSSFQIFFGYSCTVLSCKWTCWYKGDSDPGFALRTEDRKRPQVEEIIRVELSVQQVLRSKHEWVLRTGRPGVETGEAFRDKSGSSNTGVSFQMHQVPRQWASDPFVTLCIFTS